MMSTNTSKLLSLAQEVSRLTTEIHAHLEKTSQAEPTFDPTSTEIELDRNTENLRTSFNEATNDLFYLINGPKTTLRLLFGTHYDLAAHQVAFEFDFYDSIPVYETITLDALAEATKVGKDIVGRVLRLLTTQRVFREITTDVFGHSAASALIAKDPDIKASFRMQMDEIFQAASETSNCLLKSGSNLDSLNCPFHEKFGVPIFEYYKANPKKGERFGKAMVGATKLDRKINALRDELDWANLPNGPVVDVGGADGSVSITLAHRFPNLTFVVQDNSKDLLAQGQNQLPAELKDRISFVEHNFFNPQGINNASAFFIRQCLHNWNDADSVKILRGFVPALETCNARTPLLINETVVPKLNEKSRFEERTFRQVDMSMLVVLGSRQRTEEDFRRLLHEADPRFKVVKVHNTGSMGLLEVHLAK